MLGAILVVASVVMRLFTRHPAGPIIRLGLDVVAAGIAFGLVVLVVFAITRIGASGRSRPSGGTAHHGETAGNGSGLGLRPQAAVRPGAPGAPGTMAECVPPGRTCSTRRTFTHQAACSTCPGTAARPGRREGQSSRKS